MVLLTYFSTYLQQNYRMLINNIAIQVVHIEKSQKSAKKAQKKRKKAQKNSKKAQKMQNAGENMKIFPYKC